MPEDFSPNLELIDLPPDPGQRISSIAIYTPDYQNNHLMSDEKSERGQVVCLIPYTTDQCRANALKIAEQIIAVGIDYRA